MPKANGQVREKAHLTKKAFEWLLTRAARLTPPARPSAASGPRPLP